VSKSDNTGDDIMPAVRATLTIADGRELGWMTNEYPDAVGEVVLVLDANLDRAFRPDDLPPDYLIELYGTSESVKDILLAAGEAGFTIAWPADEPLPGPSEN
jgi:hypothetical protein